MRRIFGKQEGDRFSIRRPGGIGDGAGNGGEPASSSIVYLGHMELWAIGADVRDECQLFAVRRPCDVIFTGSVPASCRRNTVRFGAGGVGIGHVDCRAARRFASGVLGGSDPSYASAVGRNCNLLKSMDAGD